MKNAITFLFGAGIWAVSMTMAHAGSDRLIMAMSAQRMEHENLVYVRFAGPNGEALESDVLKKMLIREQDCNSGRALEMINDYKIGYAPKNMLVGIYLFPHAWHGKTLCFNVPGLGKFEQSLNLEANQGRIFQIRIAP